MFVWLLVVSYYYLVDNLGNIIGMLLKLPIFEFNYLIATIYISCILVTLCPFARFMDWLWMCICDLRKTPWYRLCLVPLVFIVMGGMHWEFFLVGMITGTAFPIFQSMIIVSAFIVYWQIADGLSKSADAA